MEKVLDVCLSPVQLSLFDLKGKVVVIIDVLRATSTINTAIDNGVKEVIPVSTLEDAKEFLEQGYICGAERNGKKYDGFTKGNSPFEYMEDDVKDQSIVLTTSNGTRALRMSENADKIITASFLNLTAVVQYLKHQDRDIILFCSGWKDRFSLEDTLCAGAIAYHLRNDVVISSDSGFMAKELFAKFQEDIPAAMKESGHYRRLSGHGAKRDIEYCSTIDTTDTIPEWNGKSLTAMQIDEIIVEVIEK